MIEKISIKNFKSHADTTIELGRVTALVGPNGCGKSTVLQTVYSLSQFVTGLIKRGHSNWELFNSIARKGKSAWKVCVIGTAYEQTKWQIEVEQELLSLGPKDKWIINEGVVSDDDPEAAKHAKESIAELFGQAIYFKGIANQLAVPSTMLEIPPRLSQDGSGLASVLVNLMTSDRKRREQVEQSLCAIVTTVKEINARTVTLKRKEKKVFAVNGAQVPYEEERDVPGNELIFNTASGNEIPARDMSEGTLLTLGLLTLLHGSAEDVRLFLLDDIEQGLHPLAQRRLIKTIREFAERHNKQILLTTHSGYIVDELEPENVWVLQTDEQGISHAKRLSEHQDAKRLLEVLTTGELADAVGEDWVLPQAPQAIVAGEANA